MIGEHVTIGIDSDRRVKELKGNDRPINSEEIRKFILMNIRWVNEVKIFDREEELIQLVAECSPDYMVVGSDWEGKRVIGSEYAKTLKYYKRIDEYSTSKIIESIANRR
jgi:D-beta-D-heptose 7-phosphate kinase/D-beta-D-heptose 1-phosphate adenosyltransferase